MKILLISGIILSTLFSGIIFFRKKDKSLSDKILGVWLIFLALNYLRSYLIFEKEIMFLLGFGYTMPALDAPFFFLYILTLTTGQNKFKARWLWHLTPFLLYNFYLFFFLYIKSPAERLAFFQDTTFFSRPLLFHFFEFIMVLIVPVYVAWSFIYIKNHLRNIRNRFSCKDKIDLNWVRYLLMSVSILWLMIIITKAVSGYYNTLRYNDTLMIIHYFELIIVVVIGYFGFHQEKSLFSFSEVNVPDKNTKKYASTGLS
ncbi:MAG: hypothetical protein KDC05_13670, partial [Bacteroidales bacterium]|nr:hypothetical protein [Bacteroidales bacterium]